MYSFKEINKETANKFNMESPDGHIFQTSYWDDVKTEWGSKYIGGYDETGKLVLSCMMLLRKIPYTGESMGYIPRGFTCDYANEKLITDFTTFIKRFCNENRIAFIKVDPDIHLKENEKEVPFGVETTKLFESLGYKKRISANFENIQPNFVFRLPLETGDDKEKIKKSTYKSFENKTRYNIKVAQERGLSVEVYDKDNITDEALEVFHNLMSTTGQRDNFMTRPKKYFENMIKSIYPYCRLYLVKYSYEKDFRRVSEKLVKQEANLQKNKKKLADFEAQLASLPQDTDESTRYKVEKKKTDAQNAIAESERQIQGFKNKIENISEYKGKEIYISAAIYIYYGRTGWYFYGASDNVLRDTMPNFLMQWQMIQDSIDFGCDMYDFRGVSGDLNPENPLYGLYKFKKGFNGNFVEFIGEFELVVDGFVYNMFNVVLPIFKKIRRMIRKNG